MTTNRPLFMGQSALYPHALATIVRSLQYRDSWEFTLSDIDRGQGSNGLTFIVRTLAPNAYHPDEQVRVAHYFPVPPAAYDDRSWVRWVFEQLLLVERHECAEFYMVDGVRPYAPSHGPGNDPYLIREVGTDLDRRTSFRGVVNP